MRGIEVTEDRQRSDIARIGGDLRLDQQRLSGVEDVGVAAHWPAREIGRRRAADDRGKSRIAARPYRHHLAAGVLVDRQQRSGEVEVGAGPVGVGIEPRGTELLAGRGDRRLHPGLDLRLGGSAHLSVFPSMPIFAEIRFTEASTSAHFSIIARSNKTWATIPFEN